MRKSSVWGIMDVAAYSGMRLSIVVEKKKKTKTNTNTHINDIDRCRSVPNDIDRCIHLLSEIDRCIPILSDIDRCRPILSDIDRCIHALNDIDRCTQQSQFTRIDTYTYSAAISASILLKSMQVRFQAWYKFGNERVFPTWQ